MTSVNSPEAFPLRDIFSKFAELVGNWKKYNYETGSNFSIVRVSRTNFIL